MKSDQEKYSSAANSEKKKDFSYFYDIAKLVSGNGIAQIIRTIFSPVVSRLFSPAVFGITQNFSSIANILGVFSTLRYDLTIVLPKEDEEAQDQFLLSFALIIFFGILFALILLPFKNKILNGLNMHQLESIFWLVPVQIVLIGMDSIFYQWNARKKRFTNMAASKTANELINNSSATGLGFTGLIGDNALVVARILGQFTSNLVLAFKAIIGREIQFRNLFDFQRLRTAANKFIAFPRFKVWASFLSMSSLYLPGLILSSFYAPAVAGLFGLGQTIIRLPISFVGNSIGQVFFQRGAHAYHEGKLGKLVYETVKRLVTFGLFPMFIIMVIGPEIFETVFGAQWREAGVYSQILSLLSITSFFYIPLSFVSTIITKTQIALLLSFFKALSGALSLIIGGILGDVYLGLWLFTISGSIVYMIFILWVIKAAGIKGSKFLRVLTKSLGFQLPFIGVIVVLKIIRNITIINLDLPELMHSDWWLLSFSALVAMLYYYVSVRKDTSINTAVMNSISKYLGKK